MRWSEPRGAHERGTGQDAPGEHLSSRARLVAAVLPRRSAWIRIRAGRYELVRRTDARSTSGKSGAMEAARRPIGARSCSSTRGIPGSTSDVGAWTWLQDVGTECAIVATKIDKLARGQRIRALRELESVFEDSVLPVSAVTGEGLDELWKLIDRLAQPQHQRAPQAQHPPRGNGAAAPPEKIERIDLADAQGHERRRARRRSPSSSTCRARPACASRS